MNNEEDKQLTYEELTALCRKQEEYINELEGQTKASLEVAKPDYEELLLDNIKLHDKLRELEDTVQSLLYALRKTNNERLFNEDERQYFQEKYNKESKRANELLDKLDKQKEELPHIYTAESPNVHYVCPHCYSKNIQPMYGTIKLDGSNHSTHYICEDCHKEFDIGV